MSRPADWKLPAQLHTTRAMIAEAVPELGLTEALTPVCRCGWMGKTYEGPRAAAWADKAREKHEADARMKAPWGGAA